MYERYCNILLALMGLGYDVSNPTADTAAVVTTTRAFLDETKEKLHPDLWWPLRDAWSCARQAIENPNSADTLLSAVARCASNARILRDEAEIASR